jgi:hypothetical protein
MVCDTVLYSNGTDGRHLNIKIDAVGSREALIPTSKYTALCDNQDHNLNLAFVKTLSFMYAKRMRY